MAHVSFHAIHFGSVLDLLKIHFSVKCYNSIGADECLLSELWNDKMCHNRNEIDKSLLNMNTNKRFWFCAHLLITIHM